MWVGATREGVPDLIRHLFLCLRELMLLVGHVIKKL